jgi:diguanylate cyclase (GGDEF)-like protein
MDLYMSPDANSGGNAQRPSRPRDATPPRAVLRNGRTLRLGFGPRLAVALGLTLTLVSGVGYVEVTRVLERRVIQQESVYQRAHAEALEAVAAGETPGKAILKIGRVIKAVSQRPGRRDTALIDSTFTIVAANDQRLVGTAADPEARVAAALKHGRSFAGREGDPRLDVHNFEFVTPVDLPSGRFVFEATYSHQFFDAELSRIQRSMALTALLGLLGGGVVFYLVGGRGLTRSHRFALERATLDGLTGLPNQRAFHDDLEHAVALAARHGESLALAVLDLDDFKFLNDRHGHRHGDELLLRVAVLLRDGRASDRAFRVGGDEFALLLARTDAEGAAAALRRVRRQFADAQVAVSLGLSVLRPGQDVAALREEADAALYDAKRRGGNALVCFEDIRDSVVITTSAKLQALRRLLEEHDVEIAFQPIWDLERGSLVGVEALARPSQDYGFSGPAEAFDIAEQVGRVHELDMLCVNKALAHVAALPADALLFINISPRTLDLDADIDGWLVAAVERSGIDPSRVVIEVTERFGGRMSSVVKSLQCLRAAGLQLAVDDVGTGNSGLEMLRQVHAEFVKLDRSVVVAAMTEPGARAVLLAMATFANETGAFVIAEGIEDTDMLDFLRRLEDDMTVARPRIHGGQGYGLGRPGQTIPPTTNELLMPGLRA